MESIQASIGTYPKENMDLVPMPKMIDTGTVLEICTTDNEKSIKLDHVALVSERSVGMINYELSIRGKSYLNTAPRMTVLNKN
jgi:hypothetical protein